MRLWIAEKPDAGRTIARALGGGSETGGHIKVPSGDVVTWTIGHLLQSYMPHDYDEAFREWKLEHLPILPAKFLSKPDPSKSAQLRIVTSLIKRASQIVIATDAGREGEAIAWSVLDHAGWRGPALRFWTSALNDSHLKKAVHDLIDDREKKALYLAARIRSSMDWADGINWSRYYNLRSSRRSDQPLSLGRVQTATLAILVDRDEAIERFQPSPFYELKATFSLPEGKLELFHKPAEDKRIVERPAAEDIARRAQCIPATLRVEKKPKNFSPPTPYSLPELQMTTSARWGWSAKKTLDVLQSLYEAGAVTYPRTDTGYLPNELEPDMPSHLAALRQRPEYRSLADIEPIIRKSIFDTAKTDDHHGVIPTNECIDIRAQGPDAEKLFDIVARRFIAALMPDAKGSTTSISAVLGGAMFRTAGTIIHEQGWKAAWPNGDDEPEAEEAKKEADEDAGVANRMLPPVMDGQTGTPNPVEVLNKMTKAPAHFTEGTLLKAMMSAGSKNEDAEIRELLSNGGLGTKSTRQDILAKLKERDFAVLQGKKFLSTPRAREFMAIIRADGNRLADVMATADLERELRAVEKDPSKVGAIWERYTQTLKSEMQKLKDGPAPPQLSACPRPTRSRSYGKGGKGGGAGKGRTGSRGGSARAGGARSSR